MEKKIVIKMIFEKPKYIFFLLIYFIDIFYLMMIIEWNSEISFVIIKIIEKIELNRK